ncbi:MAG: metal-binding protein [Magnetovibrio sp.]|nr:metal-binding protein [Magnetovibrio sp.]|tara:strand:- start:1057 stop:1485 length:429 start_codon:yes stop_codon:yes gene_type:complete
MSLGAGHLALNACSKAQILEVYKSPSCGCCGAWVEHMRSAGFQVAVNNITDLRPIKDKLAIIPELRSCHSAVIDGYVIEGHVPSREVMRLLKDRPKAIGLAVPGMPIGSPGMERGSHRDPFEVILFSSTHRSVFAVYPKQVA